MNYKIGDKVKFKTFCAEVTGIIESYIYTWCGDTYITPVGADIKIIDCNYLRKLKKAPTLTLSIDINKIIRKVK